MIPRALGTLVLLLAGCQAPGREAARAHYATELARDLGPDTPDESPAKRGERLLRRAQEGAVDGEALSLSDAILLALAHSEALRRHGERLLQTDLLRQRTIAGVLPQVVAHGQLTRDADEIRFGGRAFAPQERAEHWIGVRQTLLDAGLFPALDLADQTRRIEALELRDERDRLVFAVAAAFYDTTALLADRPALEGAAAHAAEALRVVAAGAGAGEAQEPDRLAAAARQAQIAARARQAELDLDRARARLARMTGLEAVPDDLRDGYEVQVHADDLPELVDRALSARLDLARARAEVERAQAERRLADRSALPKLKLEHNQWTGRKGGFQEDLDWTLGLSVDWTLFDSGAQRAELARARSAIRERRLQLQAQERDVKLEVEDAALAFRAFETAQAALEQMRAAAQAAEALEAARARAGEALERDVLAAAATRADAERNLARLGFARKLAALRLRLAVGDLRP